MGEHGTWFDYLNRFSWWQSLSEKAEHSLGRGWKFMVFQGCGTRRCAFFVRAPKGIGAIP
jgi:hypothetical protein